MGRGQRWLQKSRKSAAREYREWIKQRLKPVYAEISQESGGKKG
jgi:hypothetical protein